MFIDVYFIKREYVVYLEFKIHLECEKRTLFFSFQINDDPASVFTE